MIARDLHDGLGQDLAAIKIGLEMNRTRHPEGRKDLVEVAGLVDKALADLRALSSSIRPASLDELGLVPSLRHELAFIAKRAGLKVTLSTRRFAGRLPPKQEIAVYRILQEAVTNVLKHARAKRIRVSLSRRPGSVRLSVSDDGRGFSPKKGKGVSGLGLLGMRERVALAGGKFALASRSQRGTRIVVILPSDSGERGKK